MTDRWSLSDALRIMHEISPAASNPVFSSVTHTPASIIGAIDMDRRTVAFSFSSDAPVLLDSGCIERLNHGAGCMRRDFIDTHRLRFLKNHSYGAVLGEIVECHVADGRGYGTAQIYRTNLGDEYLRDIADGHYLGISCRYLRHTVQPTGEESGCQAFVVDAWSPVEISATNSPKDITATVLNI